jgi:Uma2 family endonuclease
VIELRGVDDVRIDEPTPYLIEAKPAMEWLLGRPVQKVSPRYAHALFQRIFAARLADWAEGRGRVGTEWRFWLAPPGEIERYLVPDVAYLSYDRIGPTERDAAEEPHVAPDVAVEIRSPDDRNVHVLHKVDVYLRAGTLLVVLIDPIERTCVLHDVERQTVFGDRGRLEHPALPGFSLELGDPFGALDA